MKIAFVQSLICPALCMSSLIRCAGVCSYEGRGGLCSIRLSEPLLKLRPRKDLVQVSWMWFVWNIDHIDC